MIDRQKGKFVAECDECGEVEETSRTNFADAWDVLNRDGWTARKVGDVWTHKCPRCANLRSELKKEKS